MASSRTDVPGGHRVQQERTTEALRRLGVEVTEIECAGAQIPAAALAEIDLLHGWWPPLQVVRAARERRVPVVLSSVYWPRYLRSGQATGDAPLPQRVRVALGGFRNGLRGSHVEAAVRTLAEELALRLLFESADLLLPNSEAEGQLMSDELQISTPWRVVPNAAEPALFAGPLGADWADRRGVLCVGRIDPLKNQLALIRALSGSGIGLTMVGPDHPHHPAYAAQCRREGSGWVSFLGPRSPVDLVSIYQAARVHVLPSWYETTGLASLEAGMSGCSVVTTERGHARDYFGDGATYLDPSSSTSIRSAVLNAYSTPPTQEFRQHLCSAYSWDKAALATLQAYQSLVDTKDD